MNIMTRKTILLTFLGALILALLVSFYPKKSIEKKTTLNTEITKIQVMDKNLADWQTGTLKPVEIIYRSNNKTYSVSSSNAELLTINDRQKQIQGNRYSVLYTIDQADRYIDALIDLNREKIIVKGLKPTEKIKIEYNDWLHSETPSDWAGRSTISLRNQGLKNAKNLCLSFSDSNIGLCHTIISNNNRGIAG